MPGIAYTANSLSSIADMFNDQAQICDKRALSAKTAKDKALERRETYAWRAAADILRATTLRQEDLTA